ncbi:ATP-binding protein [Solibacillus sp. FSL W8-0474]
MAITKSLFEAHRGTVEVESEQGEGTRFTVSLPVTC